MFKSIISKYKNNNITIYEAVSEFDQFRNKETRKNSGVIYTPKYITEYIINNIDYKLSETILEPSVGHGIFLFSLIEHVEKKYKLTGFELKEWFEKKVYAIDINLENIKDLLLLINIYFEKKGINNIDTSNIYHGDTLFFDFNMKFDCIIGNPPYIRTKNLEESYLKKIRSIYLSTSKGNVDIFYAFIELAQKISNKTSFIVPNSYIINKSATTLRSLILSDIKTIIDFKNTLIFKNVSTYTSIFYMDKSKNNKILYKNNIEDEYIIRDRDKMNNEHWIFRNDNQGNICLKDICNIKSGIATLRDSLYIIENPNKIIINNKTYYKKSYLNQDYLIETDFAIDFYKLTKLDREYKIIFPYNSENKILNEEFIKTKYPEAYRYLLACKPNLMERDKGKTDKYESWFAYGRKQGLSKSTRKYSLLIPIMRSINMKTKIITNQNFLFLSGFVLECNTLEEAKMIQKTLESDIFFNFIKNYGKPWAGKNEYFSYSSTLLKSFKF